MQAAKRHQPQIIRFKTYCTVYVWKAAEADKATEARHFVRLLRNASSERLGQG